MAVSTTIPFEKTRRSPRFVNWRAKKRSRASSAARRGKPWYEVFAASTSTASVSTWMAQYMKPTPDEDGKTPRAISESTDGVPVVVGTRVHVHSEPRDSDEHRDRDHAENQERLRGVHAVWPAERVDTVRDRLDAGQRRRARREGSQNDERGDGADAGRRRVRYDRSRARPGRTPPKADDDQREDRHDEGVRRNREEDSRLPHAAQVRDRDQQDEPDRERQLVPAQRRRPT